MNEDLDAGLGFDELDTLKSEPSISETKIDEIPKQNGQIKDFIAENSNDINYTNDIPELIGGDVDSGFIELVERIKIQYRNLPKLSYEKVYAELAELAIKSSPTPTLQVINDEIQKVQSAKDRVSELFIEINKCHNLKKRVIDILMDAWTRFSFEKSADKRKADSTYRLSSFILDFSLTESLLKSCTHVLRNLDSCHESLSRRITIYQLTMKLNDMGRGMLPDRDYEAFINPDERRKEIDVTESIAPKLMGEEF